MHRYTELLLNGSGAARIGEGDGKDERGFFLVKELLPEIVIDGVSIVVADTDEETEGQRPGTISIRLTASHAADPDTDRVFHPSVEMFLSRVDLAQLHAYLGFLLASRG